MSYKIHGLMWGIIINLSMNIYNNVREEVSLCLFVIHSAHWRSFVISLPVQIQEPSLWALCCQMYHSWPISYNAIALQNLWVLKQYRYSGLARSVLLTNSIGEEWFLNTIDLLMLVARLLMIWHHPLCCPWMLSSNGLLKVCEHVLLMMMTTQHGHFSGHVKFIISYFIA